MAQLHLLVLALILGCHLTLAKKGAAENRKIPGKASMTYQLEYDQPCQKANECNFFNKIVCGRKTKKCICMFSNAEWKEGVGCVDQDDIDINVPGLPTKRPVAPGKTKKPKPVGPVGPKTKKPNPGGPPVGPDPPPPVDPPGEPEPIVPPPVPEPIVDPPSTGDPEHGDPEGSPATETQGPRVPDPNDCCECTPGAKKKVPAILTKHKPKGDKHPKKHHDKPKG